MYSVEWNKDFENIDLYADISQVTAQDILEKFGHPDVIWASPDCTTFSIAAISIIEERILRLVILIQSVIMQNSVMQLISMSFL